MIAYLYLPRRQSGQELRQRLQQYGVIAIGAFFPMVGLYCQVQVYNKQGKAIVEDFLGYSCAWQNGTLKDPYGKE